MKKCRVLTYQSIYLMCYCLWLSIYTIFMETPLRQSVSIAVSVSYRTQIIVSALLISASLLLTRWRKTELAITIGFVLMMILIISRSEASEILFPMVLFAALFKNVDVDKFVKVAFVTQIFLIVLIVGLCSIGVIENMTIIRPQTGQVRYSMGFTHPNAYAAKIFHAIILYIAAYFNRISAKSYILIVALIWSTFVITNSSTILLAGGFIVAVLILYKTRVKDRVIGYIARFFSSKIKYVLIGLVVFVFLSVFQYGKSTWAGVISSLMTGRIRYASAYLQAYGVTLFGQKIVITNNNTVASQYTVDIAYVYMLIRFGIVFLIFFCVSYFNQLRYWYKKDNKGIIVVLLAVLFYGLSETMILRVSSNFTLIFLLIPFWEEWKVSTKE